MVQLYTNPYSLICHTLPSFRKRFIEGAYVPYKSTACDVDAGSFSLAPLVLMATACKTLFCKDEPPKMKKIMTLLAALMAAVALSMPAFAQETQEGTAEAAPQSAPAKKNTKKKHSKKKKSSKKHKKQKKESAPEGENQ